jgi:hypothetical protein
VDLPTVADPFLPMAHPIAGVDHGDGQFRVLAELRQVAADHDLHPVAGADGLVEAGDLPASALARQNEQRPGSGSARLCVKSGGLSQPS